MKFSLSENKEKLHLFGIIRIPIWETQIQLALNCALRFYKMAAVFMVLKLQEGIGNYITCYSGIMIGGSKS
jgi:hypothetical protein